MFNKHFGIKINDHKQYIKNNESIEIIDVKNKIFSFPLSQHIGSPSIPIVSIGDKVLVGQKIAKENENISSTVISSVSGKVIDIVDLMTIKGKKEKCILIENDEKYETVKGFGTDNNYINMSNEEIINIIKDAGIVGLGGATFPTHIKLSPKEPDNIKFVLINLCECEPYLTSDYVYVKQEIDMFIKGIEIILKLFHNAKAIICIEKNKKDLYNILKTKLSDTQSISCTLLDTIYPEGGEIQLIYKVVGKKINRSMLPSEVGVVVQNASTVIAISYAVMKNTPLIEKVITLAGDIENPKNIRVKLGMYYDDILQKLNINTADFDKIINGGPMMGTLVTDLHVPVSKNSSAILLLKKGYEKAETNCINCGKCIDVCPMELYPNILYKKVNQKKYADFKNLFGMDCIECGCCSFICPAHKPLKDSFCMAKFVCNNSKKGVK